MQFIESASLTVEGTLKAEGTTGEPITFSSGHTGTVLSFKPGSGASVLRQVEVIRGGFKSPCCGTTAPAVLIRASSPAIEYSTIRESAAEGILVEKGGSPAIAHDQIFGAGTHAIEYRAESGQAGEVDIHDNHVTGSAYTAIEVTVAGSEVTGGTLGGNLVTGTGGYSPPIDFYGPDIPADVTDNVLHENTVEVISVGGKVAHSERWADGGAAVELAEVTVEPGATLEISPGLNLYGYPSGVPLTVEGTLKAEGTAEEPITLAGNHNGTLLSFLPGSGASVLRQFELVRGGFKSPCCGATAPAILIRASSPDIEYSKVRESAGAGIQVEKGGSPAIAHDQILESGTDGIEFRAESGQEGEVDIHDNVVSNSTYSAIEVQVSGSKVIGGTMGRNVVTGSGGGFPTVSYGGPDIPADVTDNVLYGNATEAISVGGKVAHSERWADGGAAVQLAEVTVEPGATLELSPGLSFGATPSAIPFTVEGTLKAEGTTGEPITFSSGHTGTVLSFKPGSGASVLRHVEVIRGGSKSSCCGTSSPAVQILASSPAIEYSTVRESAGAGILVEKGGSPSIAHDQILESGTDGIEFRAESGQGGEVDIHDNVVSNSTYYAIEVQVAGSEVTGGTMGHNVVTGSGGGGPPVSYGGPDIPADVTDNVLHGNASDVISVWGKVAHSERWADGGAAVQLAEVTVEPGATLELSSGLHLYGYPSGIPLTVEGTLKAEGTAEEPITLAGNHNGTLLSFLPGSGASMLRQVEVIRGGATWGAPSVQVTSSSPHIVESTFREDQTFAIKVNGSSKPTIEYDRFVKDSSGVSYEGAGELSAPNDDWGCSSGPAPAGCGAATNNVEWKPAATLPEQGGHLRGKENQGGEGADPVILSTGALDYSHTDLSLPSVGGEPLSFTRTYSSDSSADTGLGAGWSQSGLSSATELASGDVLVVRPDGRQDLFEPEGTGYKAPSGVTDTLTKVEGTFRLKSLDGTIWRFDASGRIASATDAHGLVTIWGYNGEGRLAIVTDASGQSLSFSYNGSDHIIAVKDSTGREVHCGYSSSGELETVTDPLGDVVHYSYEGTRLKTITDAQGHVILTNVYDGQGRISEQEDGTGGVWKMAYAPSRTTVTEPDGGEETYGFDGQGRVVSEKDPLGHTTTISYDPRGQVASVDRPGGADWHLGHDAAGNLSSVKDPEGDESTWVYDSHDHPTEYTDPDGHIWHYEWSASGDLEKQTDPEGGETLYEYDSSGDPTKVTDPDGHVTKLGYGPLGERTSATDPEGAEWVWGFNARGYMTSSTQPGLKAEAFERDALGDLLSRTTPEGHTTAYEYDADGLLVKTTDPGGHVWKIERNAMERPIAYEDPLGHRTTMTWTGDLKPATVTNRDGAVTHYRYDAADQLLEEEMPEGETWGYGYGPRGERTSITDPRGHTTDYAYDLVGRLLKAEALLGSTAEYAYDPAGRLTSWKDPDGHITKLTYDDRGLLTGVERPLGQTTAYEYDAAGEPTAQITAEAALGYEHDKDGRLTGISDEGKALRSFTYEPDGRLATAAVSGGPTLSMGWTEDGELATVEDGRGQTVDHAYDSRGDLTELIDGTGKVSYAYDAAGRMESMTDPGEHTTHFSYDPEGRLTGIERPGAIDTTQLFDEAGRLDKTTTIKGEATLESLGYGYDADGDPVSMTDRSGEETTYSYDALDRLTEWNPPGPGSTTYGYDPAGNRTHAGSITYSFNALDQLTGDSTGNTYAYDGDGNLAKEEGKAGTTTYSWDPLDELTGIEGPAGSSALTYDALGRLATRTAGKATRELHYGDLGDDPILTTSGETSEGLIYGPGGLLTEVTRGEADSWPLVDGHGSVAATAVGSGEVTSRSSYGPWGETVEGEVSELGYLGGYGRLTDLTTGTLTMGARTYDPALGSFLSQDPVLGHVAVPATLDPYLYVLDDPLGRYDLSGRDPCVLSACLDEGLQGAGEFGESVAGTVAEGGEYAAGKASEWTAPARHAIASGVQDFVKAASEHTVGVCVGASAGYLFGVSGEGCIDGNLRGIGVTGSVGAEFFGGAGVGVSVGPQFSNAHSVSELQGPFATTGITAGDGPQGGVEGATGNGVGGREVFVVKPHVGLGFGTGVVPTAGVSDTTTAEIGW